MIKVAIVGGGKIGSSIYDDFQLMSSHYQAQIGDINPPPGGEKIDAGSYESLKNWLSKGFDAVLCATPYSYVKMVARVATELGIAYFDLTEDRESTDFVKQLNSKSIIVPQCGLAPGAVSIIAANLINGFNTVKNVDIRVGALPQFPNNSIQYYLTWSTDGLINEYCNLCSAIYNKNLIDVLPLEGYEKITIDGQTYEAFNTSGGIGSLGSSLMGKVENLTYKTIRYVGHHHLMKFLLDDLNLSKNRELFIKLFDQEVPQTTKDVVVIFIKATGYIKGKLLEKTYFKKVYSNEKQSAIQRTTVGGICGAMSSWFSGNWRKQNGVVRQEEIDWNSFTDNYWGRIFLEEKDSFERVSVL